MKYEHLIPEWKQQYENGASLRSIAEEYGVNKITVSRTLKGHVVTRPKSKWARYAEEWMRLYEEGASYRDIANRYGTEPSLVQTHLKKLGLKTNGKKKFAHLSKAFKDAYENGDSLAVIGDRFGVSRQTVLDHLNEEGVTARTYGESSRSIPLNETYFDHLDPQKAEHLGWMFANATCFLTEKSWATELYIHEDHLDIIQALLLGLRGIYDPHSYYKGRDGIVRIRFHSAHLARTLRSYGLRMKHEKALPYLKGELGKMLFRGLLTLGSFYNKEKNDLTFSGPLPLLKSLEPYLLPLADEDSLFWYSYNEHHRLTVYRNEIVNLIFDTYC
ncbi:hypothetical protein IMZ31_23365 (plasmid) [Pontibacillus sp. ALD_SL1]|uniref:helix-turn-helix domain-containing protein n=1 Tax=Pontibacillus sp. ALD_SL1 TaxID=2777185 RepID=UPI001A96434D|nr:helix-turn-helix domain-containing protein [Pontibacillus sp. ALD_SL1]QST02392.1 hypothetical protein IMZ31_23365 [Pontibacillus sp. ALD_SL1]